MSEFQHYEWLALDRPLNAAQLAEVKRLSSHMDRVTSTNASVSYSYGDFKHDPLDVLARYFDVFFYHANWGTKTVAFRFSSDVIKRAAIEPYLIKHCVELEQRRDFWILSITLETENDYAWIREEDEAASAADIAGVRRQIAQGDYRALYLMWLAKIQEHHDEFSDDEDYDEDYESEEDIGEAPPLPADLKNLDAALNRFCKFFAIDANLVAAAAQQSAQKKEPSRSEMKAAIASLSRKECDDFLLQLLDDQSSLSDRLRQRLGLTSIVVKWGKRLLLVPFALPFAALAAQALPLASDPDSFWSTSRPGQTQSLVYSLASSNNAVAGGGSVFAVNSDSRVLSVVAPGGAAALNFEAPLLSLYALTGVVADSIAPSTAPFASL